jgi:hypothetical protein
MARAAEMFLANVSSGGAMPSSASRANLGPPGGSPHDGHPFASFDGVEEVGEVPGASVADMVLRPRHQASANLAPPTNLRPPASRRLGYMSAKYAVPCTPIMEGPLSSGRRAAPGPAPACSPLASTSRPLSGLIYPEPSAWPTRTTVGWHPGRTRYESGIRAHPTTPNPPSSACRAAQRESWGW